MKVNQSAMMVMGLFLISDSFADVNIDDFSSGMMSRIQTGCSTQQSTVNAANVPSGGRRVSLIVSGSSNCNENTQRYVSSSLETGLPLVVNNDYGISSRMELRYGISQENKSAPMNLNLLENGKIGYLNVTFAGGITNSLNFNAVIYMKDGSARSSCGLNIGNNQVGNEFNIALPLEKFISPAELAPPDYKDVDYIDIIVQSEKTNFSIKSVKVTSNFTPNSITVNEAKCYEK